MFMSHDNIPPPYEYHQPSQPSRTQDKLQDAPARYRDVAFILLFLAQLVCFLGLFVVGGYKKWIEHAEPVSDSPVIEDTYSDDMSIFGVFGIAAFVGLVFALSWLVIVGMFTRKIIHISIISNVFLFILLAIYSLFKAPPFYSLLNVLAAILIALFFYWWRNAIPFATEILQAVVKLVKQFPATLGVTIGVILVQLVWTTIWSLTVSMTLKYQKVAVLPLLVYLIFSYYWTSQVIKNIVHVTTSGTFATWYFLSGSSAMPHRPTASSFRRAITWSFGSICFGSLLIAVVKTIRTLVRSTRNNNGILASCIDYILSCVDWILQYFNHYSLVIVAIYGKSYLEAAKEVNSLLSSTGVQAIVNDNIISTVMVLGSLIGGTICGAVGGILAYFWLSTTSWPVLALICFWIGMTMVSMALEVIESGVSTILVCFAEDTLGLQRNDRALYERFVTTYQGNLHLSF